jgi:vacuolar-type H+-ATPase subunit H
MNPEKSLLQKIREKELEMSVQIEHARREADQIIDQAKKEATELIAGYEGEADTAVADYDRVEKEKTREEVNNLKTLYDAQGKAVQVKGEQNSALAVEKILRIVAPE